MSTIGFHVGIQSGDGMMARFGQAAGLIPAGEEPDSFVEDFLRIIEARGLEGPYPAPAIASDLMSLTCERGAFAAPSFGVVAALGSAVWVLLHRSTWAYIHTDGKTFGLSGRRALTWIDQIVVGPVESIAVTCVEGAQLRVNPLSDLRSGRVSGTGFVVHPYSIAPQPDLGGPPPESSGPAEAVGTPPEQIDSEDRQDRDRTSRTPPD